MYLATQLSELVENKTKELLMPGVTREQDRVNRCARAVKARVTLLVKDGTRAALAPPSFTPMFKMKAALIAYFFTHSLPLSGAKMNVAI